MGSDSKWHTLIVTACITQKPFQVTRLDGRGWEPDYAIPATHALYWVNEVIGLSKQWDQRQAYGEARTHQRMLTCTYLKKELLRLHFYQEVYMHKGYHDHTHKVQQAVPDDTSSASYIQVPVSNYFNL